MRFEDSVRPPTVTRRTATALLALLAGALPSVAPVPVSAEERQTAPEPGNALLVAPSPAPPAAGLPHPPARPIELPVRPGSTVTYHLDHTLHDVYGISRRLEGTARLSPAGSIEVSVRVRVDSFDSGNSSRDAKVLEVTEAARFPFVNLDASGTITPPSSYPTTLDVLLSGTLMFHGIVKPVSVPARATFTGPGTVRATATFPFSLKSFEVEPPSLLFMVIKDRAVIDAKVILEAAPP